MPRAQWICRSCEAEFDTRGKRDVHHRKEHQKMTRYQVLKWRYGTKRNIKYNIVEQLQLQLENEI